jgi:Ser/Thr protein kinase RdoA (MazF antagonist)
VVLDALASVGLLRRRPLLGLSSYENRVYQVHLEDPFEGNAIVVAKFYRPNRWSDAQIAEEHAFAAELQAAEVPAVAPLAPRAAPCTTTPVFLQRQPAPRRPPPELDDGEVLEWIGRYLARLHIVGAASGPSRTPRAGRGQLRRGTARLAAGAPRHSAGRARRLATRLRNRAGADPHGLRRGRRPVCARCGCTATCHPGNILWTPDAGPHFVDLDDARTGPAVQDLWMLLSGERVQRQRQLGGLLDGYEQMREFDRNELALIEPLRTLRLIHYSAWLARRWDDPAFPRAFPGSAAPTTGAARCRCWKSSACGRPR